MGKHIEQTCANASLSTSAKAVAKLATPAGSFTASSTASNLMARCHPTKPLEVVTIPSTPFSPRQALARRLLTLLSTACVSSPTNVPVSRGSWSSTLLVAVPALVSGLCFSSVCRLTTARSPSSDSASTLPLKCPQLLLSHTTPYSPPTRSSSTLMWPSCWTTRPSTTSAVVASTSSAQPTPT